MTSNNDNSIQNTSNSQSPFKPGDAEYNPHGVNLVPRFSVGQKVRVRKGYVRAHIEYPLTNNLSVRDGQALTIKEHGTWGTTIMYYAFDEIVFVIDEQWLEAELPGAGGGEGPADGGALPDYISMTNDELKAAIDHIPQHLPARVRLKLRNELYVLRRAVEAAEQAEEERRAAIYRIDVMLAGYATPPDAVPAATLSKDEIIVLDALIAGISLDAIPHTKDENGYHPSFATQIGLAEQGFVTELPGGWAITEAGRKARENAAQPEPAATKVATAAKLTAAQRNVLEVLENGGSIDGALARPGLRDADGKFLRSLTWGMVDALSNLEVIQPSGKKPSYVIAPAGRAASAGAK